MRRVRKTDLVLEAKKGGRKGKDQVQAELHFIDENEPVKSWEYAVMVCNAHHHARSRNPDQGAGGQCSSRPAPHLRDRAAVGQTPAMARPGAVYRRANIGWWTQAQSRTDRVGVRVTEENRFIGDPIWSRCLRVAACTGPCTTLWLQALCHGRGAPIPAKMTMQRFFKGAGENQVPLRSKRLAVVSTTRLSITRSDGPVRGHGARDFPACIARPSGRACCARPAARAPPASSCPERS